MADVEGQVAGGMRTFSGGNGSSGRFGPRRTRAALLTAVVAEVELMRVERVKGPASLLIERLAIRGVRVTAATLRAGDCREHLEKVWSRRPASVSRFGPTGGHDLRKVDELVEHVIDLENRIGRVRADIAGDIFDRQIGNERDTRSLAACGRHDRDVERRVEVLTKVLRKMAAAGVVPDYDTVSDAMTEAGEPLTPRTIRRNEAYWRPLFAFNGHEPPKRLADPRRAKLRRKRAEELGAMVYRLIEELADVERLFRAKLEGGIDTAET